MNDGLGMPLSLLREVAASAPSPMLAEAEVETAGRSEIEELRAALLEAQQNCRAAEGEVERLQRELTQLRAQLATAGHGGRAGRRAREREMRASPAGNRRSKRWADRCPTVRENGDPGPWRSRQFPPMDRAHRLGGRVEAPVPAGEAMTRDLAVSRCGMSRASL
jgi:hypothetical protein